MNIVADTENTDEALAVEPASHPSPSALAPTSSVVSAGHLCAGVLFVLFEEINCVPGQGLLPGHHGGDYADGTHAQY